MYYYRCQYRQEYGGAEQRRERAVKLVKAAGANRPYGETDGRAGPLIG